MTHAERLRVELDEPVAFQIATPGWRALAKDHPGVWFCSCGMGWLGTAASYPADLRAHALFRAESGEKGEAHDPGLARFRPDHLPAAPAPLDELSAKWVSLPDWRLAELEKAEAAPPHPLTVERLARIEQAATRLMKVIDLASSVHTPERRAAMLALRAALRDEGDTP